MTGESYADADSSTHEVLTAMKSVGQRWSRGHKARGQGQRHKKIRGQGQGQTLSRPRTGMLEAKAKDQGHKRECSPKKKKKGLHKNFSGDLHKKTFFKRFFKRSTKFFQFKKYCCPRAEDRPIFEDLRPRGQGQGQGLDLRGQGLQNVSSRTPPLVWGSSSSYCLTSDTVR